MTLWRRRHPSHRQAERPRKSHFPRKPISRSRPRKMRVAVRGAAARLSTIQLVFQEAAMPKLIVSPTIVQCVGNINKTANEFVGLVNTGDEEISITRVQSPPGWVGVGQYSDYREYRLVFAGTLHVEH